MTGPRSDPPIPMLTTWRMRLPVCPFQAPLRTRFEKSAIASSTAGTSGTAFLAAAVREVGHGVEHGVNVGHDVLAVHEDRRAARCAQRDMQDGAVFGHVDPR